MEHTLPPAWLSAVGHSRYLANQLSAHPELIPELLATWQQRAAAGTAARRIPG